MHILILPSWYPKNPKDVSGVFFRDQALALLEYGHKVGVVSPQMKSIRRLFVSVNDESFPYFENDSGLLTYRKEVLAVLPRIPYGNYWLFTRTARHLIADYISEHGKPDIIHAHSAILGGAAAVELGREFHIPVVLTEHSSAFARDIYMKWQLSLASKVVKLSQSCISVSPALGKLLNFKLDHQKVSWKWIPNVVAERFQVTETKDHGDCHFRFLNLALMTENKGQKDLLQAFGKALNVGVSAELWLAGDGPLRIELEQMALDLGLADKIRFLGRISPEEVPVLLKEVDVMVISSHYETFGVVAAEGLMAGLPVIATRSGGPECIISDGDGILVPVKQPDSLAAAMIKVYQEIEQYDPIEIIRRAKARFSGPAVAEQLTKEYEQVLANYGVETVD